MSLLLVGDGGLAKLRVQCPHQPSGCYVTVLYMQNTQISSNTFVGEYASTNEVAHVFDNSMGAVVPLPVSSTWLPCKINEARSRLMPLAPQPECILRGLS